MLSGNGFYEVVWPRGARAVEGLPYAKRLDSLAGKIVCELWDWMFHGDKIFPMIEKEMAKRYPNSHFVSYKVFGSTHGGDEAEVLAALPDKLKQTRCDAVVSGIGC